MGWGAARAAWQFVYERGPDMTEREIFIAAVQKASADERAAYLQEVCASDSALRERVRNLLRVYENAGGFLESPAPAPTVTRNGEPPAEGPGTVIGPYKLLEPIGEGGMGVVYMAEQVQPIRRKVALKIIKPGMDTKQVIARFEAERQALALMDHPNIARVLDAGATESGRPYFVMELVRGIPIAEYCDREKLSIPDRLGLFVQVCQAVQHAHQKGIIHRDIKPSNVLVTLHDGVPVPKVIDFGIAKAMGQSLTEKTLYTGFAQLVGTPLYMSPEQAEMSGPDVDTRSDIYSLGVLLYELLTGTTPFDKETFRKAAWDEVRRIIREQEPPKPSTRLSTLGAASTTVSSNRRSEPRRLGKLVSGELDWIVMKAIEKDRRRRYETASGLALDIERHLADEPVTACPPSTWYRLGKFARRNRFVLATTALVFLALVLGMGVSTWQAIRATRAERQAQEQKRLARQAVDEMYVEVVEKLQIDEPRIEQMRRGFLEKALRYYEEFVREEGSDPDTRLKKAEAYCKVGRILSGLGQHGQAETAHRRSIEILEGLIADFPSVPEYRFQLVKGCNWLGIALGTAGRTREAEQAYLRGQDLNRALVAAYPGEERYFGHLTQYLSTSAVCWGRPGGCLKRSKPSASASPSVRSQRPGFIINRGPPVMFATS
jgi:serine/threonine protein kinase